MRKAARTVSSESESPKTTPTPREPSLEEVYENERRARDDVPVVDVNDPLCSPA